MKILRWALPHDPVAFTGRHSISIMWPFLGPLVVDTGNPSTTYQTEPFTNPSDFPTHITAGVLAQIRQASIDSIRLEIAPGPWMEAIGNTDRLNYLFGLTDTAISSIVAAGLNVIISLHTSNYIITAYFTETCLDGSTGFGRYNTMVGLFATRYANHPKSQLALSLFNEPPALGSFSGNWTTMQRTLYATARAAAPDLTLILTSYNYSSLYDMAVFDPAGYDTNTVFDIHPYIPFLFAIQGYPGSINNKYLSGIEWPPESQSAASLIATATANINADGSLSGGEKTTLIATYTANINAFVSTPQNQAWMSSQLDLVTAWARSYNISPARILCGEYGVTRTNVGQSYTGASPMARAAYLTDIASMIKAHGFRRNVFSLDAPDYGVTLGSEQTIGAFDGPILIGIT